MSWILAFPHPYNSLQISTRIILLIYCCHYCNSYYNPSYCLLDQIYTSQPNSKPCISQLPLQMQRVSRCCPTGPLCKLRCLSLIHGCLFLPSQYCSYTYAKLKYLLKSFQLIHKSWSESNLKFYHLNNHKTIVRAYS